MGVGITGILQGVSGAGTDEELFGTKPKIPDYPLLEDAQNEALRNDESIFDRASKLTSRVNSFNQDEIERMLRHTIPDISAINTKASARISDMVGGAIPQDIQDLISRKAAERGIAGGFNGSGMHRNLAARDLGLTSLQLVQQGLSSADRWIESARRNQMAPLSDVTSMFVSPAQQFAANESKFQRDLYAATLAAAPDPAKRGAWDSEMSFLGMVLSAYGGGAGYQNTYRQSDTERAYAAKAPNYGGFSYIGETAGGYSRGGPTGGWDDSGGWGGSNGFSGEGGTAFV